MSKAQRPSHPSRNIELRSVYNMSQLDMFRIDAILWRMDNLYMECGIGNFSRLIPFYFSIKSLYHYLKPLMHKGVFEPYEKWFAELLSEILAKPKPTYRECMLMFLRLEELQNEMLRSRQMLGVGFSARRPSNDEKYLKPEFGGLPDEV